MRRMVCVAGRHLGLFLGKEKIPASKLLAEGVPSGDWLELCQPGSQELGTAGGKDPRWLVWAISLVDSGADSPGPGGRAEPVRVLETAGMAGAGHAT